MVNVLNATDPTPAQIEAFLDLPDGQPVFMVNLLKFKDKAEYKDGEAVSGKTAYGRYAKGFGDMLAEMSIEGVETVYGGAANVYLIGNGDWDAVAIVRYPDAKTMFDTVSSAAYRKIHHHRRAGLEGQLLISCNNEGVF
ncbi:DUF1330 domain-containing protein [Robiginitomaculum antarcticum]|uniref:DUF1330 domain-containing protein n=1 Tax=Robiginitomaculum antarcticum TaxID=437507 RepID=UPI0003629E37|nr:DUF1330 domain-containing protein [Robiginitomaculum antarcticum]